MQEFCDLLLEHVEFFLCEMDDGSIWGDGVGVIWSNDKVFGSGGWQMIRFVEDGGMFTEYGAKSWVEGVKECVVKGVVIGIFMLAIGRNGD